MKLLTRSQSNEKSPSADSLLFKSLLSEGKKEEALKLSDDILAQSRLLDQRDFETEAWIRMERALLGEMENNELGQDCLLYTSPSPRDKRQSRMPSSA